MVPEVGVGQADGRGPREDFHWLMKELVPITSSHWLSIHVGLPVQEAQYTITCILRLPFQQWT